MLLWPWEEPSDEARNVQDRTAQKPVREAMLLWPWEEQSGEAGNAQDHTAQKSVREAMLRPRGTRSGEARNAQDHTTRRHVVRRAVLRPQEEPSGEGRNAQDRTAQKPVREAMLLWPWEEQPSPLHEQPVSLPITPSPAPPPASSPVSSPAPSPITPLPVSLPAPALAPSPVPSPITPLPVSSPAPALAPSPITPLPVSSPAPLQLPLPQSSVVRNGLINFGASCYINAALQMLNSIPWVRERIMTSANRHPLVLVLREIFSLLHAPEGIQRDHLRRLLEDGLLPILSRTGKKIYTLTKQSDIRDFLTEIIGMLEGIGEPVSQYFKLTILHIRFEKSNPDNRLVDEISDYIFFLWKEEWIGRQEIPVKLEEALLDFSNPKEFEFVDGRYIAKDDATLHKTFKNHPKSFLIHPALQNVHPIFFPLEFTFPQAVMVNPKLVKYRLASFIIYLGDGVSGHFIFYLRDGDYFWEYNDSRVRRINNEEAQDFLKTKAWLVLYERED
jgi:hypothetical protein